MPEEKDSNLKKGREEVPVELESQFILRLPTTPAAVLRAALRSGVMNIKDRLTIQIESDFRHGIVRFDKFVVSGKIVDIPCIAEAYKTLDRKTFYKTADICQILICKEEDDIQKTDDEESPKKKEKKDAKDKKYLYPHGITPALKNVRKRRHRKTLKKKYVDFPEIEKEVKRLFRMDNEAINVRYEVVNADEDKGDNKVGIGDFTTGAISSPAANGLINSNSQSMDVAEHDIFGEVLSSSDDEDDVNIVDLGDDDTSRLSSSTAHMNSEAIKQGQLVTEFSKEMLESPAEFDMSDHSQDQDYSVESANAVAAAQLEAATAEESLDQILKEDIKVERENAALIDKLGELEHEIAGIQARRQAQELEISSIENQALKQRFQSIIDSLRRQEAEKQREYDDIVTLLHKS